MHQKIVVESMDMDTATSMESNNESIFIPF